MWGGSDVGGRHEFGGVPLAVVSGVIGRQEQIGRCGGGNHFGSGYGVTGVLILFWAALFPFLFHGGPEAAGFIARPEGFA